MLSDGRGFRAHLPELATPELVAGGVILWPVVGGGEALGLGQPEAEIVKPFGEVVIGAVGEPALEGVGLFKQDLRGVDDYAFDGGMEDHLAGEGVEGHLVRWGPLIEVIAGQGGDGGLPVHDV